MAEELREDPGEHLYRSVVMTAISRFNASRRLSLHGEWSLWTISLCSLYLIVVSLLHVFGFVSNFSDAVLSLLQITASVVILLFSTALNGYRFGERAEKMHDCALRLNALGRDIEFSLGQEDSSKIEELRLEYDKILSLYENHRPNDWHQARFKRFKDYYDPSAKDLVLLKVLFYLQFLHYGLLNIFFIFMIIFAII